MEKRLSTKLQNHQLEFKNAIKGWVEEQEVTISCGDKDKTSDFLRFVFDFTNLTLSKDDFENVSAPRIKFLSMNVVQLGGRMVSSVREEKRKGSAFVERILKELLMELWIVQKKKQKKQSKLRCGYKTYKESTTTSMQRTMFTCRMIYYQTQQRPEK